MGCETTAFLLNASATLTVQQVYTVFCTGCNYNRRPIKIQKFETQPVSLAKCVRTNVSGRAKGTLVERGDTEFLPLKYSERMFHPFLRCVSSSLLWCEWLLCLTCQLSANGSSLLQVNRLSLATLTCHGWTTIAVWVICQS